MITISSRLQEKNVIDFKKEKAIMLLDRKGTKIEFKQTEISEQRKFLALVKGFFSFIQLFGKKSYFFNHNKRGSKK